MYCVKNEKGSVLVFITLMIVLLLVMVGLGLDTGHQTYARSQGQAAVDAAALAAISGLTTSQAEVEARAKGFNSTNDYVNKKNNVMDNVNVSFVQYNSSTGAITSSTFGAANAVRVALEKTNPYSGTVTNRQISGPAFLTPLLRILGSSAPSTTEVNVSAVAYLTAKPSIPIAIFDTVCSGGNVASTTVVRNVLIRQSSTPSDNSCWTSYLQNPPSANVIQDLFTATRTCTGGPTGNISVGTPIEVNNGQQNSDYQEAMDLFITQFPGDCWRVPVVTKDTSCNQQSPILGWARICPTEVVKSGNPKYIKADVSCGASLETTEAECFTPRLVREPNKGY